MIGRRRLDPHLDAFRALGAMYEAGRDILISAPGGRLRAGEVFMDHGEYTGSAVAKRLLAAWNVEISRFRKVMPTDYKRVLAVMRESEAAGLTEDETMAKVMEASHG